MRSLLLLLIATQAFAAYSYKRTVTVDHTKVPNTDQTNFPVLISGTYTELKTAANAGHVQSASGYDIAFYSDSGLTTQLAHEVEFWSATTGQFIAWVRIATLATASDTVFYLAYGDASISSSQQNAAGVWSGVYLGVWHFPNGTTLSFGDSTGNITMHTETGGTWSDPIATAGIVDGGVDLSPGTRAGIHGDYIASMQSTRVTVSAWINTSRTGVYANIVNRDTGTAPLRQFQFRMGTANKLEFIVFVSASPYTVTSSSSINSGAWVHVVGTYNGTSVITYVNGSSNGTPASITGNLDTGSTQKLDIGYYDGGGGSQIWDASIDEARWATDAKSADWIATEYNNQSNPGTFYQMGNETTTAKPYGYGAIL